MVHVSLQHIIGTVALIGLAVSLALAYQIVVGYVEGNVIKTQLSQIAEYTSMSITNIISLTDFVYGMLSETEAVSKHLNLPAAINGKPYNLSILEMDGGYHVRVSIIGRNDLYAESPIALGSTQRRIMVIFTGGSSSIAGPDIEPRAWVYGGNPNTVVWCRKVIETIMKNNESAEVETIYAGLGIQRG
ncbi:MAG: hypothetical protein QXS79_06015 [Candidatus Bathyarchaeia archaeon]